MPYNGNDLFLVKRSSLSCQKQINILSFIYTTNYTRTCNASCLYSKLGLTLNVNALVLAIVETRPGTSRFPPIYLLLAYVLFIRTIYPEIQKYSECFSSVYTKM